MNAAGEGPAPARPPGASRLEALIDALVTGLLRGWLAFYLVAIAVFTTLPFAAPLLARAGQDRAASAIYLAYRLSCHQLPHHSWFIGGPKAAYSWPEVQPYTGLRLDQTLRAFHHPLRDPALGYQVAFCQRDAAIWLSLLAASLILAWRLRRGPVRPLRMRWYLISLIPIALDGLTQLVGLRESTPLLRTLTGAIFGAATAWLVLPLLDEGFRELRTASAARRVGPT
ncbi:MAG: DUF2085 domain-containing protein [Chloroflexi bacterium]|nr:DUF2085 domain-containing protein [Chloroflexota bacterium]